MPNPRPGSVFVFLDVPFLTSPDVAPGNDGPYLFNNGLQSAIRLEYGRTDLFVTVVRTDAVPPTKGDFLLDIRGTTVVLMP